MVGCDASAPNCHFGGEHSVFSTPGLAFDDVALLWQGTSALALFSDATGLYARRLDPTGTPASPSVRLGPRCDAGIAVASGRSRVLVACSRRPVDAGTRPGGVTIYGLDPQLHAQRIAQVGHVGPSSRGVALWAEADTAAVAYQDEDLGLSRVWLVRRAGLDEPELLSEPGWSASAPGLSRAGGRLYAYWAETRPAPEGAQGRVRLRLAAPGSAVTTLTTSRDAAPSPDLVGAADGLWLAQRDRRKSARKPGLYLMRVGTDGSPLSAAHRAARADGIGRPVLTRCLGGLVAATPRTFAGDYFVGVVRADGALRTLSAEQQFYEDSHEYSQVSAACEGARALLLIAERPGLGARQARLRAVTFSCDAG